MSSLEDDDTDSLADLVYVRLRKSLMQAELKPHQRLKVRDLAVEMGTSETPVREALLRLSREGGIEIKPRHYIRVRRLSLAEFLETRDMRLQLEPLAAERALPFVTSNDIDRLASIHQDLVKAEASGDWRSALQANFDFHFGLYSLSKMSMLIELLESIWIRIGPLLSELYPDAQPTYVERHQHLAVLDALTARESYALRQAIQMDLLEGGRNLRMRMQYLAQQQQH